MKTPQVKPSWNTGIAIGNGVVVEPDFYASTQGEQDLENAMNEERVNNPSFDQDVEYHNKASHLICDKFFKGKPPMLLTDAESKEHSKKLAKLMTYYYDTKNLK